MALFTDYKAEPCRSCYFTDWQHTRVKRIKDIQMVAFSQTCRVCGFSEVWWTFYEEGE